MDRLYMGSGGGILDRFVVVVAECNCAGFPAVCFSSAGACLVLSREWNFASRERL